MRSVILMGASSYANATVHIPRSITIARSRDSVFFMYIPSLSLPYESAIINN